MLRVQLFIKKLLERTPISRFFDIDRRTGRAAFICGAGTILDLGASCPMTPRIYTLSFDEPDECVVIRDWDIITNDFKRGLHKK